MALHNRPIPILVAVCCMLALALAFFAKKAVSPVRDSQLDPDTTVSSPPETPLVAPEGMIAVEGILVAGSDVYGSESYCPEGQYLRVNQTTNGDLPTGVSVALHSVVAGSAQYPTETTRFFDAALQHATVRIIGRYPAQEATCMALTCECDAALAIDSVAVVAQAPESPEIRTVIGKIICLSKKGSGPQTMECARGLLAENGDEYHLANLGERLGGGGGSDSYTFRGFFTPESATSNYNALGTIDVLRVE